MILTDYDLETFVFKEPIQLFYTDGKRPLSAEIASMDELTSLLDEIHQNGFQAGIGGFSIDFQLWFVLARKSKLFRQELPEDSQ